MEESVVAEEAEQEEQQASDAQVDPPEVAEEAGQEEQQASDVQGSVDLPSVCDNTFELDQLFPPTPETEDEDDRPRKRARFS